MAEKSTTILSKKLISLNKTFNTLPTNSKTSKESSKNKKTTSTDATSLSTSNEQNTSSTECLTTSGNKKTSIFSTARFSNGNKSDKIKHFASGKSYSKSSSENKSTESAEGDTMTASSSFNQTSSNSKSNSKSSKSVNKSSSAKYTSFFTSNSSSSTARSPGADAKSAKASIKQQASTTATAITTISHVSASSSLTNSPKKSPSIKSNSLKSKGKPQGFNSLPKFKFSNKKKSSLLGTSEPQQQWHADSQLSSSSNSKANSVLLGTKASKMKEKPSPKLGSQALKSKTAKTINTFVKPIKRSSLRFENKKLLFTSTIKPKIIENLTNPTENYMLEIGRQPESSGLKVSFEEQTKTDRHRSNSDNARLNKKQNIISSLRRSIFANQEIASSPASDRSLSLTHKSLPLANKSLSNRMMGMISKGKSHLAIVRSHSLESNKFSSKRKSQPISKSQSKLIPQSTIEPTFDEYKFLPLKWLFANNNLDEQLIYIKFFKFYKCYDLIPTSSKLVVFDTQLLVKKAFSGLVTHGVKAVPLWVCKIQCYVGMLTISYFINILIDQYENCDLQSTTHFEEQKLDSWKDFYTLSDEFFISIDPDANVFDAIHLLIKYKIHRLPVMDPLTQNVIYVLTHKRILKFLYLYYSYLPMPSFLQKSIKSLQIGTYSNIETVTPFTCLLNALNKFIKHNISSLPIVDGEGKLLDVFCKFDLFNLAANKMYSNLDISIKKALEQRVDFNCELLVTCFAHTTLHNVIELFVSHEAHRLIVVDESDRVIGIICLSDVLKYLITDHSGSEVKLDENEDALNSEKDLTNKETDKKPGMSRESSREAKDEKESPKN